jgi:hypothetical protein
MRAPVQPSGQRLSETRRLVVRFSARARGTGDATGRPEMLAKDRAVLRNLIIVMVASTGGVLAVGTTCLGRDRPRPPTETSATRGPANTGGPANVRSSAGGVVPTGTGVITSGQMERGGHGPSMNHQGMNNGDMFEAPNGHPHPSPAGAVTPMRPPPLLPPGTPITMPQVNNGHGLPNNGQGVPSGPPPGMPSPGAMPQQPHPMMRPPQPDGFGGGAGRGQHEPPSPP